MADNTRAVPGTDLSIDIGHEGSSQPMAALRGGCAAAPTQQPLGGANTGAQRPGPNAMDTESPDSGFMGGVMGNYSGSGY
ncbi:hypothetical protein [Streptomyces sp. NPDC047009]|uniref:hypothetical protein n=1 Tax=Streptomyces sp. NPDC047009 TaxID=3154496 RepID=UPI0033C653A7